MMEIPWNERDHFGEFERAMDELDETLAAARETAPHVIAALSRVLNVPFPALTTEQRDRLQDTLAPIATLFRQAGEAVAKWEESTP